MIEPQRLRAAYEQARSQLLAERVDHRHWEGELSSSALSTATAVSALSISAKTSFGSDRGDSAAHDALLIDRGVQWLASHQNQDGGWGDTDQSHTNIATTMLVMAALHLAGRQHELGDALAHASACVDRLGGVPGVRRRYGRDKTFAVPILTNSALAQLVPWSEVVPLPFELACVPQRFYRWLSLPVVSYAIPALVAIGQARFVHCGPRFPLVRLIRRWAVEPSLRVLERMQPHSGGYLEAVPLTSFVIMSLASTGRADHPVTRRGVQFLRDSVRADGSWPIDTNLATWATSLAIHALSAGDVEDCADCADWDWLLRCQHTERHPFTGADPGGWGWTNLSGAVPDADDTAAALLALKLWDRSARRADADRVRVRQAAADGLRWLLRLQNRDGGWPTFCRGWGKLPFDRSGADLTAHALRAMSAWSELDPRRTASAADRSWRFLRRRQHQNGSWTPLWFGHQDHPQEENPVFGTSRVLMAYATLGASETVEARRGYDWLVSAQRPDGGWNGGVTGERGTLDTPLATSSVEETSLAVEALLAGEGAAGERHRAVVRGVSWLMESVEQGRHRQCAPIGLYFAKLWYYERLYPQIFTVAALGQAVHRFGQSVTHA